MQARMYLQDAGLFSFPSLLLQLILHLDVQPGRTESSLGFTKPKR